MTRFTIFTGKELNNMESAFRIALDKLDGMGVDTSQQELKNLIDEVSAEKRCREKIKKETPEKNEEIERHRILKERVERLAMNSNYGVATRSCDDDEKLVVLCMINKQLKDMQETLAKILTIIYARV